MDDKFDGGGNRLWTRSTNAHENAFVKRSRELRLKLDHRLNHMLKYNRIRSAICVLATSS
jgi:hypothetical protein